MKADVTKILSVYNKMLKVKILGAGLSGTDIEYQKIGSKNQITGKFSDIVLDIR